ncbi:N-alpha-acetyltransferase 80 isoform X1 [Manis pentadactyla]|uniref:N-alpha-acetyltransferase 80 isoform X1 n=2 Tax=Manis pentadactyla TaxID=143292 RepID=UPI00255C9164|nr:N-alpha-acetyltransferase 80 isoform X1 [Manis pentadactyla]
MVSSRSSVPSGGAPLWSKEMPPHGDCGLNAQPGAEPPETQQEMTLAPSQTQLGVDSTHRQELNQSPGPGLTPTPEPTHRMELTLSPSPAKPMLDPARRPELTLRSSLAKLTPGPARQPELTLSPRLAELIPGSTCCPEMTLSRGSPELPLEPSQPPEETPAPRLAELTLEPAHCRPELLGACADLINEQWPRSRASRLHSLGQSSDAFPLCVMLLSPRPTPGAAPIVVGHARLSRVLDRPQSLLVETVVVARALRGQGFGRCLMEGLEAFAQARGFRRLHLTTHDQLYFYAHLGYQLGEPVQGLVFTSQRLPATLLRAFPRAPSPRPPCKAPGLTAQAAPRTPKGPPLPPPPPLPEPLTTTPPPPAGAPPQGLPDMQYQDLRGCPIFWMEKDI